MTLTAGIDLGSTFTKVVITDGDGDVVATSTRPTGFNFPVAAEDGLGQALEDGGVERSDIAYIAATGFGRYTAPMRDLAITELTCHAYGTHLLLPQARTVLDAGGQTVKAIRIDEHGRVRSFRLNDKCAAGAGAFLQKTVKYMGYEPNDIARLAEAATKPVTVSSVCTVFAESEIINHLSDGRSPEDVSAGAVVALAGRAAQLVKRVKPEPPCALTGGLTRIGLMARELERIIGTEFLVPADGFGIFTGAYGAALLARQRLAKKVEPVGV